MPIDKSNYINSIWKIITNIIQTNFNTYTIDVKQLSTGTTTIANDTILILHPRISPIGKKKTYNDPQLKVFRINIFCLADNSSGIRLQQATKMAGEISSWIEHNQFEFSKEGIQFVQVINEESVGSNEIGSEKISGYVLTLQGKVLI